MNTSVNLVASNLEQSILTDEAWTANISKLSVLACITCITLHLKGTHAQGNTISRKSLLHSERELRDVLSCDWPG